MAIRSASSSIAAICKLQRMMMMIKSKHTMQDDADTCFRVSASAKSIDTVHGGPKAPIKKFISGHQQIVRRSPDCRCNRSSPICSPISHLTASTKTEETEEEFLLYGERKTKRTTPAAHSRISNAGGSDVLARSGRSSSEAEREETTVVSGERGKKV
jgi:hypothetical protein